MNDEPVPAPSSHGASDDNLTKPASASPEAAPQTEPVPQATPTEQGAQESTPPLPAIAGAPSAQANEGEKQQDWRRRDSFLMLLAYGMLAASALAGNHAACRQLDFAEEQADKNAADVKAALEQTTRSADAATKAAEAATKAADAAERNVEAIRESTRIEQRAWVGMTDVPPAEIKDGKATFTVRILNSGRSPALGVKLTVTAAVVRGDLTFRPTDQHPAIRLHPHVLQPGTSLFGPVTSSRTFDPIMLDEIKERRQIVYLFGRIEYSDIFGVPHTTRFCMRMTPDLKSGGSSPACVGYDTAN